jgi:hypothetical protein
LAQLQQQRFLLTAPELSSKSLYLHKTTWCRGAIDAFFQPTRLTNRHSALHERHDRLLNHLITLIA